MTLNLIGRERTRNQVILKPVFSLNDDDVWKLHAWGAWLDSFDISPDGKTFAAEFEVLQEGRKAATWVGIWDTTTRKLITERQIESPATAEQQRFSPFDLRFTPNGNKLVALTGPKIEVLDAGNLNPLYSIWPGNVDPATPQGILIR